MGTEGGVSRFDGSHFSNFTLEDGLPDIEVMQIFADSKGRVWMAPFNRSICFYYQGKIHNQENDPVLKHIPIRSVIVGFAENKNGDILFAERTVLHLLTAGGEIKNIDTIDGTSIETSAISTGSDGNFLVQDKKTIFTFSNGKFTSFLLTDILSNSPVYVCINSKLIGCRSGVFKYKFYSIGSNRAIEVDMKHDPFTHVSLSAIGDSLICCNGTQGVTEYNIATGTIRNFQIGGRVSRTFRDDEGNIWFTTLGLGLFRLNSEGVRHFPLQTKNAPQNEVFTIRRIDNELMVGTTRCMLFRFALPSFTDAGSKPVINDDMDEVHYIEKAKNGRLLIGTIARLLHYPYTFKEDFPFFSVKEAVSKNDSEILAGGNLGAYVFDKNSLHIKDILWRERATTVYYFDNAIYIGTLNGLYEIRQGRSPKYLGDYDPLLKQRISSIAGGRDSTLWIATYGGGIIGWKDGRRVAILTRRKGLSSDLCRVLYLQDKTLWVGTDKGLNKVDLGQSGSPTTSYTVSDGLSSDIINTIYADSSMVYVGSPAGLNFFNSDYISKASTCRLTLLGVINSRKNRLADTASLRLPYLDNNIRFEFVGISYMSGGNITYRYRLLGLDSTWKTTKETFLDYPTLPYKEYTLQLQAINKFGKASNTLTIPFTVATPFWNTIWFDVSVLLIFFLLTWYFVNLRVKQLRSRQAQREELTKRMTEMEHMALQAQMNPHFIFNCLNSIQQTIFDQDMLQVNKYVTGFARLIRATLHNSSKTFISLTDEINYLSTYLSLEKFRFKEKMDYKIEVDRSLQGQMDEIQIPPMLIQPYVENSLRHGLRHRTGNGGFIWIKIIQEGSRIAFVVEDNGVGRDQAGRYKTREHIEYQSRGMSLTADRIRLINVVNKESIDVEIIDLKNTQDEASGTRVIIRFPRFDLLL
jgi:ligand-binding sensor domain-containing protein